VYDPQNWGALGQALLGRGVADPKKHAPSARVTTPNLVDMGQTVWAQVWVPKIFRWRAVDDP